jgi:hypothetical protein
VVPLEDLVEHDPVEEAAEADPEKDAGTDQPPAVGVSHEVRHAATITDPALRRRETVGVGHDRSLAAMRDSVDRVIASSRVLPASRNVAGPARYDGPS